MTASSKNPPCRVQCIPNVTADLAPNTCSPGYMQAADDAGRLSELQQQAMLLTAQVQQLLPLQPKLSTAEVERDTALHKLERLQVRQCMWGT